MIIEGSINDRRLPATGYREAVTAAWDALAALYPSATIVVLGPAPQVLPVEETTARIDADLVRPSPPPAAGGTSRPIAEEWITPENYADVIDTAIGRYHPSTGGHAYLATRLAEALADDERRRRTSSPTLRTTRTRPAPDRTRTTAGLVITSIGTPP